MILSPVGWEANTRLLGYIVQELYKALIPFSAFLPWIPKVVRGYFSYNCFLFGIFKPRECSRMSLWVDKEIERKGLEILCERKHLQNIHDWLSLDGAVKKQPYNYKHWSYFELLNLHKAWIYVFDLGNVICIYAFLPLSELVILILFCDEHIINSSTSFVYNSNNAHNTFHIVVW